jgi:hypothetical protein
MPNYGKRISVAEGNGLLTRMMTIRQRFDGAIDTMTENDAEAHRYYCGGDAIYIFGKDSLKSLWDRAKGADTDCIFAVFPASRDDQAGRPTLMVFIYVKGDDGKYHLVPDPNKGSDDGLEHPGGNGTFTLEKDEEGMYRIPETIPLKK